MHQERQESISVLLLPKINQRSQSGSWKLIELLVRSFDAVILLNFLINNILALFKHLNLLIKFIHIILIFENQVFIYVSNFKLKILGSHRQRKIPFI